MCVCFISTTLSASSGLLTLLGAYPASVLAFLLPNRAWIFFQKSPLYRLQGTRISLLAPAVDSDWLKTICLKIGDKICMITGWT